MKKETVKIVITGHIDHGKSTFIGRLLIDTNSLPKDKMKEIDKIAKELGRDTQLAFVTDQLKEERERNITIDTTQIFFKTQKRNYCIIDAPGHVEFLKNMISGATQAEAAVLIIDAKEGLKEQTRRHAYIISFLGIKKVIAIINKMDLIDYSESEFNRLRSELFDFMTNLGIEPSYCVPISAKEGANVSTRSRLTSWYKGPSVLEALDSLKIAKKSAKIPLRFPIQDIYDIGNDRIIVGRVASGVIRQGQDVTLLPSFAEAKITAVKAFGKTNKKEACSGENIGLIIQTDKSAAFQRGQIIVEKDNPPKPTTSFKANIFWMSPEPLRVGKPVTLRCATQEIECVAINIEKRIDSSTLQILEERASLMKENEAGMVTFKSDRPIVVEIFSFVDELGRFVIEHQYNLRGAGIISEENAK